MRMRLVGWSDRFSVVEVCKLLVTTAKVNLMQAKTICEALLDGETPAFDTRSDEVAAELVTALERLKVEAEFDKSNPLQPS